MSQFYALHVSQIIRETDECVSVSFDIPETLRESFMFTSGQYLTLKTKVKGEDIRRSYSLCSAPHEGKWTVAIKKVENGRFSTYANEILEEGDVIEVMPPMGNFIAKVSGENKKTYVAMAAGSGITPIMSIVKSVMKYEPRSKFILFYGNKNTSSIIFKEELDELKNLNMDRLSVNHVLSREKLDSDLFFGRITPEKCDKFNEHLVSLENIDELYICGPGNMVQQLKDHFIAKGMESSHVHAELFTTPDQEIQEKKEEMHKAPGVQSGDSHITIKLDNHEYFFNLEFDTNNILDAAIENGVDLPFSCKGGVCCTCRAKLVEGEAQMMVNYALEPDEVEEGFILTCQSYPRSSKVKIDFDE